MTNHPNRRRPSRRCDHGRPVDRAKIARTAQLLRPWYRAYLADQHKAADDKPEGHTAKGEPHGGSRRRSAHRRTANHRPNRTTTGDKGRADTSR